MSTSPIMVNCRRQTIETIRYRASHMAALAWGAEVLFDSEFRTSSSNEDLALFLTTIAVLSREWAEEVRDKLEDELHLKEGEES